MTTDNFQSRVDPWVKACFGPAISADKDERNARFIEEALELVQSAGCTREAAHGWVDYVFNRETGVPAQEVGGVMVTLAALCLAHGMDMHAAGEIELARISQPDVLERVREKQRSKPRSVAPAPAAAEAVAELVAGLKLLEKHYWPLEMQAESCRSSDVADVFALIDKYQR